MKKIVGSRYFKKIYVFDALVIFIAIALIGFGLSNFSREKSVVYIHTVTTNQDWIENYPTFYWVSNSINAGDEVYDTSGVRIAEVLDVENVDFGGERREARLKLKIFALYDNGNKSYRIGDRVLRVGENLVLNIGQTRYEGMITYVGTSPEPSGIETKKLKLRLKSQAVELWLANSYNNLFRVADTKGNEILRIIDVEVLPHEISVATDRGDLVRSYDPVFKDVYINTEVEVKCQEEVCYFNGIIPIKIGNAFWAESSSGIIEEKNTKIIAIEEIGQSEKK